MPGTSDGGYHVPKSFKDVETLRREEYHRRRLLRLEQVRQQSKDVASLVRQKVQSEREKQLGLVQERVSAKTQQWQVRKLKALQSEYEKTVQTVGKGHTDAAFLPDQDAIQKEEADRILAAAQKRGQEALYRLKEEEAARRKADEERRLQLHHVRAVEEARSAAVVALPRPESTVGLKSFPTKTSVSIVAPPLKGGPAGTLPSKPAMPEWPRRQWPQEMLPLGMSPTEYYNEQGDLIREENEKTNQDAVSTRSLSVPVAADGDSSQSKKTEVEQVFTETSSKSSKQTTLRNSVATASNSDVKLYDYSSCYQSQYDKTSGIVKKVQPSGEINAKEAADKEIYEEISTAKSSSSSVQREQQRSKEALQRVQVHRDYKHLMGSLSLLSKQNAALLTYHGESEKPWIKGKSQEEQLKLAVENLLQDAEMNISDSVESHSAHTPDGSLIVSQLGDTPDSAPRLNVGRWQPREATAQPAAEAGSPKADSSSTDSIVIAPPPPVSQPIFSARPENNERDAVLRSLVQRINDERHLLLSSQQPSHAQSNQLVSPDDKERDIRHLEEKVLQQRQQLKLQRSEVKRLDASIAIPACMKHDNPDVESPLGSSLTHESIIIEHSRSDESDDTMFPQPVLKQRPVEKERKSSKRKNTSKDENSFVRSPAKDGMMYSMDVSLSSVIMDQSENSSSGSKSVSLHGVQVVVKVCGAEEDTSESRSVSFFAEEDQRAKVTEIPSDGSCSDPKSEEKKKCHRTLLDDKTSIHKGSKKDRKGKKKVMSQNCYIKEGCKSTEMPATLCQQDKTLQSRQSKKKIKSSKTLHSLKKVTEELDKKKTGNGLEKKDAKISQKSPQSKNDGQEQPASSSTSYLSPPDRVLSSLTEDIKTLMALAQRNIPPQPSNFRQQDHVPQNRPLVSYINKLLAMSRESIDRLNVSCSEVSTPSSAIFQSSRTDVETDPNMTDIGLVPAPTQIEQEEELESGHSSQDHIDHLSDLLHSVDDGSQQPINASKTGTDQWLLHAASTDQGALTDMTKQCHEKISTLTKMIEEVRRQAMVNSPINNNGDLSTFSHNQSRSPFPLDSTAYMSPPPEILEWADIAMPTHIVDETDNRMSLDPYSTAVMHLLADVRSRMASAPLDPSTATSTLLRTSPQDEPTVVVGRMEPGHLRPKPPVAFWRNIERCNVTSPTEPHELSTIPELGTTLPESVGSHGSAPISPIRALSPSTPGTPPDVIAELLRRNLLSSPFAWAKKMEKRSRSSGSTSPLKNSLDSDLSLGKTGTGHSDISASKETNTLSLRSQNSSSNCSSDWKTNILMSPIDLCSSADEVEGDFRRMGIGWVGAMLRKTKEVGALSSTSSSEGAPVKIDSKSFRDLSGITDQETMLSGSLAVAVRQGRGHSTPVKNSRDLSSSSGSHSRLV